MFNSSQCLFVRLPPQRLQSADECEPAVPGLRVLKVEDKLLALKPLTPESLNRKPPG